MKTYTDTSFNDKKRLVNYLTGSTVLEVGFGTGDLLSYFHENGYTTSGVDVSNEAILNARENNLKGTFIHGELSDYPRNEQVDNLLFCSVMHEIYSYERNHHMNNGIKFDLAHGLGVHKVIETLKQSRDILNEGGRIIIRDGLKPSSAVYEFYGVLYFDNSDKFQYVSRYNQEKYSNSKGLTTYPLQFAEGSIEDVTEFLYTYTWSKDRNEMNTASWKKSTFEREIKETYATFTKEEWGTIADSAGFKISFFTEYFQLGYKEILDKLLKVELYDYFEENKEFIWPSTNMIMVLEKK